MDSVPLLTDHERVNALFAPHYLARIAIICGDGKHIDATTAAVRAYSGGAVDTIARAGCLSRISRAIEEGQGPYLDDLRDELQTYHRLHRIDARTWTILLVTHTSCGGYQARVSEKVPGAVDALRDPQHNQTLSMRVVEAQMELEKSDSERVTPWLRSLDWVGAVELLRYHDHKLYDHSRFFEEFFGRK
jgi:hypothetical protein